MKLTGIEVLTGTIELLTGLHIGSGNNEMHIGGTDNPVIKNPITDEPYIPGSSIKGKIRSMLEWQYGLVGITEGNPVGFKHLTQLQNEEKESAVKILKLFGGAPDKNKKNDKQAAEIGPSRLLFWDCNLDKSWVEDMSERNLLLTEMKMENTIDRIRGTAGHPRNMERVPAGAIFDFKLSLRVHDDEKLLDMVLEGLSLLELTGLGGSGTRGCGKLQFTTLKRGNENLKSALSQE